MKRTAKLLVILLSIFGVGGKCSRFDIESCQAFKCTEEEKAEGCVDDLPLECYDKRRSPKNYARDLEDGDWCTNAVDAAEIIKRLPDEKD